MIVNNACAQHKLMFLVAGQSNAVGHGDSALSVIVEKGAAFEYRYRSNTLYPLQDPVGANELNFQQAQTGSAWPAFANRLFFLTKKQIVIVAAARGGSSCHQKAELSDYGTWDTTGNLFPNTILKSKAAIKQVNEPLAGIIWLQGERDANAINSGNLTAQEYLQALQSVIGRFRRELNAKIPFYIVQTGYYQGHPPEGYNQVQEAQEKAARLLSNVYVIYKTRQFAKENQLKDGIHYTQPNLNEIGEKAADAINKLMKHNRK